MAGQAAGALPQPTCSPRLFVGSTVHMQQSLSTVRQAAVPLLLESSRAFASRAAGEQQRALIGPTLYMLHESVAGGAGLGRQQQGGTITCSRGACSGSLGPVTRCRRQGAAHNDVCSRDEQPGTLPTCRLCTAHPLPSPVPLLPNQQATGALHGSPTCLRRPGIPSWASQRCGRQHLGPIQLC